MFRENPGDEMNSLKSFRVLLFPLLAIAILEFITFAGKQNKPKLIHVIKESFTAFLGARRNGRNKNDQ